MRYRMMHTFKRRDELIAEFNKAAGRSFYVIYRALSELANERQSSLLDKQEVLTRIAAIRRGSS